MLRVLLVDDELRILTDIEKHVPWKMLGISHIFKARSVREALDIFHKYTPEIIISDIEMSGQTGIDLLHAIRKENADTKFLFLTCHSEFDYMQNAIRLGSCDYLLKPINYDELTSTLQNLINNYEKNSFQQAEHSVIHGDSDMIEHAKQYIADHFIEEIKISDIAGHLHCSEPYVMKIFKKNTGYSILEYITNQRMNKACELLKNTDWNISFIAYMCGYDDNSYFTRVFKKVVGISPTTYRKKKEENYNMKSILFRFMLFICPISLILCSGCDHSANNGESDPSVTEQPYEIVIELLATAPNKDLEMVEEEINKIILKEINCTVKFREVMIDKHEMELYRLSDKNRMDIVVCGITTSPFELKNNGILLGLNDLFITYGSELYEKCGRLMDACYINDDYYFIPGNLYPASQNSIIYNEDLLQKYNIAPPAFQTNSDTTINNFFYSIKQSGYPDHATSAGDGFTMVIPGHNMESFGDNNNYSFGVLMDFENDSEIINIYETDEFYQYCNMMQQWYNDGYLKKDSLINGSTLSDDLNNENIICAVLPYGVESFSPSSASDNTYQHLPLDDTVLTESSVTYQSLGITTFSEHPEKCMEFLNLMYTDSTLSNLINYGIEDIHYVKKSEHIIAYPDGITNSNSSYGNIIHFGDARLNYMHTPFTEQDYEELEQYSPSNAVTSSAFGYTFNTENVNKQISAVNQVIKEYRPGLVCGITDIDDLLPKFIDALKEAGIDEIIAENQRQFDQWKNR